MVVVQWPFYMWPEINPQMVNVHVKWQCFNSKWKLIRRLLVTAAGGWLNPWCAPGGGRGVPRGPCGEPWADSCLLTCHVPQNYNFFFFVKKKKTNKPRCPRISDMLACGVTAIRWPLCSDARAGRWPSSHARPLRILFCLQLLRFISATPHMPPSGFRSGKFLLKQDFDRHRFCQLFPMYQHCYARSKPWCSALQCTPTNLPCDNHPKGRLSSASAKFLLLIAPSENPTRNFHQLGLCLQLSPVCPSCWKPFWDLTPFDCPSHPSASHPYPNVWWRGGCTVCF